MRLFDVFYRPGRFEEETLTHILKNVICLVLTHMYSCCLALLPPASVGLPLVPIARRYQVSKMEILHKGKKQNVIVSSKDKDHPIFIQLCCILASRQDNSLSKVSEYFLHQQGKK